MTKKSGGSFSNYFLDKTATTKYNGTLGTLEDGQVFCLSVHHVC